MAKRAILIVLDGVGIGALPDAARYGDLGAHTLGHVYAACPTALPNLWRLGLANIQGSALPNPAPKPMGAFGRARERSPGKDTTTGHWEISGAVLAQAFPTFPQGFPADFIVAYEAAIGRGTLGNYASSGTAILDELGARHMATGSPIVYTSADSVFQIAAHEQIIPPQELYRLCRVARNMLTGPLAVGRVIARPFVGQPGAFMRTGARRDFSLTPPETMLDILLAAGLETCGVGKIEDIFCNRGLTGSNHASGNLACIEATLHAMRGMKEGLIFTNLVDYDMLYGHRNDAAGFAQALRAFDDALPAIFGAMGPEDMLIITADHGCDPTHPGTDHTREHIPLLCYGKAFSGGTDLGTRDTYADIAATVLNFFGLGNPLAGTSWLAALQPNT
ncbi:MAG: phosphopentomutase [Oscillospiraceae bacterium]|nr:phosphopentomutase [Oscillospiraceae bacterium]